MSLSLAQTPATEFLSVAEQIELISAAQDVPVTISTDDDGAERVTYGKTPASELALERLTTAFLPLMVKVSGLSKILDPEEAFAVALVEFVAAVRRYDLTSDVPFSATIRTVLLYTLSEARRASDLIVVKENVAARYWRLMHKHAFDLDAAYAECRDTSNGFDPSTFLAVHRALTAVESLDTATGAANGDHDIARQHLSFAVAGPEERLVEADTVRWLFTLITDRQETILRLRFGFRDLATENLLVASGLHLGSLLSDVEIAEVTAIARSTVNRQAKDALAVMRAACQQIIAEVEA